MPSNTGTPVDRSPGSGCQCPQARGLGLSADWRESFPATRSSVWEKKSGSELLYPQVLTLAHCAVFFLAMPPPLPLTATASSTTKAHLHGTSQTLGNENVLLHFRVQLAQD